MRLAAGLLPLVLLAASPSPARAGNFPTRQGESGLLDVPDARIMERRTGMVGLELGYDHAEGMRDRYGPMPFSIGVGLGRFEWGISVRESGHPGDPQPSPMLFSTAIKVGLLAPTGTRPGLAVDAYLDRFNDDGVGGGRLIFSTGPLGHLRLAGFAGYERQASGTSGLTAGLAAVARHASGLEAVLEGLYTPRGTLAAAAVRYDLNHRIGIGLVGSYLPDQKEYRIALAFGFKAVPAARIGAQPEAPVVVRAAEPEVEPRLAFGDRPMFKLRIRGADPGGAGEPRHLQHGPYTSPALAGGKAAAPQRVAAPSADDVLGAQLRDQAAQAEASLKRLRNTDESLAADEANLEADARRLDERERVLASREAQLEARERRVVSRGFPTEPQRQLESQEAQLAAAERQLAATERGFEPTREAALGSERDARDRELAERAEVERLTAQAEAEQAKARQGELRREVVAARGRMVAAAEARVVARGERLDASGRQLRTRGERVETWQRRLDVRAQRIELLEQRAAAEARAAGRATTAAAPPPLSPKDKAVFVMVVKSPTAIMKAGGAKAGGDDAQREALMSGAAVEKAVAAATVVTFATPGAKLSELDRETIDGIARLAARENGEVLVWARAKDPSMMGEANRRAEELRALVISLGSLDPRQVNTRVTTRPGAQGVDVVISALREGGKAKVGPGTEAAASAKLASGETARRQLRDAVQAVQPAIERCVTEQMVRRGLTRSEGSLRLTVSAAGQITGAEAGGSDLGGSDLETCLKDASTAWRFPSADGEYVVDVPITVVSGGAKP